MKYAIRHIPTNQYFYVDAWVAEMNGNIDFGSAFLIDKPEMAFDSLIQAKHYFDVECKQRFPFSTEDEELGYPVDQFEIVKI